VDVGAQEVAALTAATSAAADRRMDNEAAVLLKEAAVNLERSKALRAAAEHESLEVQAVSRVAREEAAIAAVEAKLTDAERAELDVARAARAAGSASAAHLSLLEAYNDLVQIALRSEAADAAAKAAVSLKIMSLLNAAEQCERRAAATTQKSQLQVAQAQKLRAVDSNSIAQDSLWGSSGDFSVEGISSHSKDLLSCRSAAVH